MAQSKFFFRSTAFYLKILDFRRNPTGYRNRVPSTQKKPKTASYVSVLACNWNLKLQCITINRLIVDTQFRITIAFRQVEKTTHLLQKVSEPQRRKNQLSKLFLAGR